jgi:hypothetical protein
MIFKSRTESRSTHVCVSHNPVRRIPGALPLEFKSRFLINSMRAEDVMGAPLPWLQVRLQ